MTKALKSLPGQKSAAIFSDVSNKFIKAEADLKKPEFQIKKQIHKQYYYKEPDSVENQEI